MKNIAEGGQPEKGLSREKKDIAMSFEKFKSLSLENKIFLVLVWRGLKKASPISLEDLSRKALQELESIVKKAKLFFKSDRMIDKENHGLNPGKVCFVAGNYEDLEAISELWFEDHNQPEISEKLGILSGYPLTAIKAHAENSYISEEKKIEKLQKEPDLIPFATLFHMSEENFEEELKIVRRWAKEIKLVTPALYSAFKQDYFMKKGV